ncbi:PAS domain-containing hybrid sensor histidine kinase/response regulator [Algoriphagus mannitolivorans]|uniref:PAS domain-containing hybrid sensor histidine kinase/response regulator n=1 Tax=Algoriphagus mannitolivorans TaxID=226504 RepID=UPI000401AB72|nr:PAS domain-containing hybrid sensor histidine kinase/response regulator [Algoriphagus mannitolivorans]
MFKNLFFRNNFWRITLVGTVLVILVVILGIGFFNAISQTQIDSRKDFLTQQTALAARGLEGEVERFTIESNSLLKYLVDSKQDGEDLNGELTSFTRRIFNAFPKMIDKVWVGLGDSTIVFSLTERNDFIRQKADQGIPDMDPNFNFISLQTGSFKILYRLDLAEFCREYVSNFYLDQGGEKFLLAKGGLISLSRSSSGNSIKITEKQLLPVQEEVAMGLKGLHEISWENELREEESGILVQYPFNFSPSQEPTALVFVVPTQSLASGVFSTFLYLFLVIGLLLIGTAVFFTISLKNNLDSEKIQKENLEEISTLFEQQNLLMGELRGFVFFHDSKGEMTRVSDEVEEVLGHSKEEFIQAFKKESSHPDILKIKSLVIESLQDKKEYLDFEYDFVKPSGQKLRLKIFSKLIYGESGVFEGGLGLCTDITKQYHDREEIIHSENRLRTLIQNIPDNIFIYDNEGRVLDFHVQDKEVLLKAASSTLGKKLEEFVPHGQAEDVVQAFRKSRETGSIQGVNVFWLNPLGTESHFEMRFFPLDESQMVSISKDITGQKIWEKGLIEARDAAERANKSKSEFLANMSHEIRTPMNGLLGIIDLLESTKLDKIQKQYVEIIKNSGNSLLSIIRDILDYSKIESGELEINARIFDPVKELKAQGEILSGLAKKKKINLIIHHQQDTQIFLEGDKDKINQVLLNLISNSLKFTPEKGSVEVRMDLDELDSHLLFLSYSVKDTGIGISPENIQNLTKPFYQVDSSNSRNFQGTGLGLAIAKKIIELMGGELRIESELGKGSEFSFTVLVRRVEAQEETQEHVPLSWKDVKEMGAEFPLKILLAEDNELNRQLMTLMFEQLGFQFEIAVNGLEALEKVKENEFDVVLMDVQMPVMNGLETTRKIRELGNRDELIIIGLSANVFEEDQNSALKAGMNDYLTKPIRLAALADKLEYYFRKTRDRKA